MSPVWDRDVSFLLGAAMRPWDRDASCLGPDVSCLDREMSPVFWDRMSPVWDQMSPVWDRMSPVWIARFNTEGDWDRDIT